MNAKKLMIGGLLLFGGMMISVGASAQGKAAVKLKFKEKKVMDATPATAKKATSFKRISPAPVPLARKRTHMVKPSQMIRHTPTGRGTTGR